MILYTCSEVPIWIKWFSMRAPKFPIWIKDSLYVAPKVPDLNQMILYKCSEVPDWIKWFSIRAPKSRSESNDSRSAPKSRSESNDSRYVLEVLIWIKWFATCSESDLKWFAILAPMSRSESNDSRYVLRSPDLNQMIRDTCSKSRSESNDSRYVLRSPDLNWDATDCDATIQSFEKLSFTHHYVLFQEWMARLNSFFLLVNRSKWSMSRVWVWINRSGSSVNDSLNWIGCSVHPFFVPSTMFTVLLLD